jgi:hypothetical protein
MSRWSSGALKALTFASLIFASGIGPAAATYECGHRYRICNMSCAQTIEAGDHAAVCRTQCDFRLIACGQTKPTGSADGGRGDGKQLGDTVLERPLAEEGKPLVE